MEPRKHNEKRLAFFLLLIFQLHAYAQLNAPGDIPSPNAAALGRYGDIPMSYYIGNANVSIPLHTLSVDGLDFPLMLTYDTSGLLVNSLPSWTGLNWTLQAGGVIVRKIQGACDELILPSSANYSFGRYFDNYSTLQTLMANTSNNYAQLKAEVTNNKMDLSPDIFIFNFMGKTGKFFLGSDGNWKVRSNDNIEVVFDIDDANNYISPFVSGYPAGGSQPKTIKGFQLRDEDGYIYTFGGSTNAIEYTTDFFSMSIYENIYPWSAVSWYLTSVKDRNGRLLYSFSYERGRFIAQVYNCWQKYVGSYSLSLYSLWGLARDSYSGYNIVSDEEFPYGISITSPVYLKKIETANGVFVDFISENAQQGNNLYFSLYSKYAGDKLYEMLARRVSRWVLQYNPDQTQNLYNFYNKPGAFYYLQYDFNPLTNTFTAPVGMTKDILARTGIKSLVRISIKTSSEYGNSTSEKNYSFQYTNMNRVVLSKIEMSGSPQNSDGQNKVGTYSFYYYNLDALPQDYLTKAVDHWGYYNGHTYQDPTTVGYDEGFKSQRNPNAAYCKYGMLKEIVYPTGGTSIIDYEPHSFSKRLSFDRQTVKDSVGISGGVRVSSITEYTDASCTTMLKKRNFSYNYPITNTSSGELFSPAVYKWSNNILQYNGSSVVYNYHIDMFRSTALFPLSNFFGPHIGYSYVTETFNDGSKTTYVYSNISNPENRDLDYDVCDMKGRPVPNQDFSERGFMRGNLLLATHYSNTGQKVKSTGFTYRSQGLEKYILSSNLRCVFGSATTGYCFAGGVYRLYYPRVDVVEENDTLFYGNGNLITQVVYNRQDRTINMAAPYLHKADVRTVEDITTIQNGNSEKEIYYYNFTSQGELATHQFCLKPSSVEIYRNNNFVSAYSTKFKNHVVSGTTYIVPDYETKTYPGNRIDTLVTYSYQDSSPLIYKYKKQGEAETFLKWDDRGHYLMMKGSACSAMSIPASCVNDINTVSSIKAFADSSEGKVTGYTYNPLVGVTSVILPTGEVTYYEYDWFGRLTNVYDANHVLLWHYEYHYKY